MPLKIAIVGTGNVAFHLAKKINSLDWPLTIISRSLEKGHQFVLEAGLQDCQVEDQNLAAAYDVVILAVQDHALQQVLIDYQFNSETTLVHTSGAQPMDVLQNHPNFGVVYPLQTFTKAKPIHWEQIPILLEANNQQSLMKIRMMAQVLSSKIIAMDSEQRLKVHLSAVFACNFTNHLYQLASEQLRDAGLELKDLQHLMQETLDKAIAIGPKKAQTGPAKRGDLQVIEKHLKQISGDDNPKAVYELMTKLIRQE